MLNLEIIDVIEDVDPTSGGPRLRARVKELKPRTLFVNLKNCDAEHLNMIKANVGGIMSLPAQEMMFNGRFMLSIPVTDEDFFVIRPPEAVSVSKVTEISSTDSKPVDTAPLKKVG